MAGSAELSDANSDQWQQSLPSSVGGSGTFASSDASAGSSSLYQSGTEAAGAYSNGSYSYLDGSGATMTAEAPSGSSMTSDTWTQQSATTATLGGTQQQEATAAYSYHAPTSSNTLTNSGSSMAAAIPSTAVVQFADPDPTVVAAADVAQMVPTPSIGGGTSAAPTASGTSQPVGSASIGGMAPGATAPVPITVNMQLIADTADWVNTTQQAPPQVTTTSIYNSTLHGWQPAAAAAMSDLQKRVDGVNFAMTVYSTVVVPAMNTAKWLQGSSIGGGLLSSLMLSDTSGEFANAYARTNQAQFSSSSSDPLVRWVDNALYNNGQPLTAGSAPLYGTYYDPRTAAGFKVTAFAATVVAGAIAGGFTAGVSGVGFALADGVFQGAQDDGLLNALGTLIGGSSTSQAMSATGGAVANQPDPRGSPASSLPPSRSAGRARAQLRVPEVSGLAGRKPRRREAGMQLRLRGLPSPAGQFAIHEGRSRLRPPAILFRAAQREVVDRASALVRPKSMPVDRGSPRRARESPLTGAFPVRTTQNTPLTNCCEGKGAL